MVGRTQSIVFRLSSMTEIDRRQRMFFLLWSHQGEITWKVRLKSVGNINVICVQGNSKLNLSKTFFSLWGFYIAFTMLLFVLSLLVTDIVAKFLFWWVWQNGGIDLGISKIWQVHKALIVSVAWYRKVFFCTDIIYVAFFPNEPL